MEHFKKIVLCLISISLFTLSIPPFHWNFLGWIAFVPFYIVIVKSKHRVSDGLLYGLIFGMILYGLAYVGIYKSLPLRIMGITVIILFQSFFYASHSYFVGLILKLVSKKYNQYLMILLNWVVLEFLSNKIFFGFSMYASMSQYENYSLLYLAQYMGMFGISFLVITVNLLIAHGYLMLREEKWNTNGIVKIGVIFMALIFILIGFEVNNQRIASKQIETSRQINVALLQGNVSDLDYKLGDRNFSYSDQLFAKYLRLSAQSLESSEVDLIIWPETSIHRYMLRLSEYRNRLLQFARDNQVAMLVGSQDFDEMGNQYNSVFLISSEGSLEGKYDKTRLFPFTEKAYTAARGELELLEWQELKLGINICFESNFPEHSAQLVRQGADLLCVLSNNGAFGLTRIPYFTSAFSIFRAVENRKYLIQVMNTGISQIITPMGVSLKRTKLFTEEVVHFQLPLKASGSTFYSLYGEFVWWILTIVFILITVSLWFRIKQNRRIDTLVNFLRTSKGEDNFV